MSDPAGFQKLVAGAAELLAEYYERLPSLPVMPQVRAGSVQERLAEPLPLQGTSTEDLLATVRNVVIPTMRHNGHPRFFGYIASRGTPVTAAGEFIAAALNPNVTAWRSAPGAASALPR